MTVIIIISFIITIIIVIIVVVVQTKLFGEDIFKNWLLLFRLSIYRRCLCDARVAYTMRSRFMACFRGISMNQKQNDNVAWPCVMLISTTTTNWGFRYNWCEKCLNPSNKIHFIIWIEGKIQWPRQENTPSCPLKFPSTSTKDCTKSPTMKKEITSNWRLKKSNPFVRCRFLGNQTTIKYGSLFAMVLESQIYVLFPHVWN